MNDLGVNFERLRTAVDWSVRQLATPRKKRIEAIKEYVGYNYADGGSDKKVPTNLLELAITIYTRQLAARAPQVLVTTGNYSLRPYARSMELALNQIPGEIDLGGTLRRAVIEAMFSFAVVKVGICSAGCTTLGHEYGEPFADLVSIDDYFVDMSAKSRNTIQFEGNDYWLTYADAMKLYEGSDADSIKPDDHTNTGDQGETRAESVSSDEGADLFEDKVWLRDVWIPSRRKVVTYGVKSQRLFRVVNWDGPNHGPYHVLGFSDVPGNILPLPPVALWRDLHELANNLFRKLGKQADKKKTVAAFSGGNDDDAERLKKADDGDGITYSGQKPEQVTVGGIDAPALAFFLQVRDLFSYVAGNLDTLGGLAPQTDTVGQDKLLAEAASSRIKSMGEQTVDFVKSIFKALAWYEWTDPIRKRTITKTIKGADISITREWSAETRQGNFIDYNFDIDVYSMQDDSPSSKLQKIGTALERFIFPALPMVQQQGGTIDLKALVDLIGRLGNIPEIVDVVKFQDPADVQPVQGNPQPSMKAAHTTRTYERVNRPGATRQGKDHVMGQLLMGGKVQPSEMAAMGRRTS